MKQNYFFTVRDEANARVEELPSGQKVFYIHVGNIPNSEVGAYLEKVKERLSDGGEPPEYEPEICGDDRDLGFDCAKQENHAGPCHTDADFDVNDTKGCDLGRKLQQVDDDFEDQIRAIRREKWERKCRKAEMEKTIQRRTSKKPVERKSRFTSVVNWKFLVATISALTGVAAAFLIF